MLFTHVRGEVLLPVGQIARVEKGRTLGLFDNQLILTLHDSRREVFQLPENRDRWHEAVRPLVSWPKGAYR